MVVNKKAAVGVLIVMGAGFVNALGHRRRTTAEYSEYSHLVQSH